MMLMMLSAHTAMAVREKEKENSKRPKADPPMSLSEKNALWRDGASTRRRRPATKGASSE